MRVEELKVNPNTSNVLRPAPSTGDKTGTDTPWNINANFHGRAFLPVDAIRNGDFARY